MTTLQIYVLVLFIFVNILLYYLSYLTFKLFDIDEFGKFKFIPYLLKFYAFLLLCLSIYISYNIVTLKVFV